LSQRRVLLQLAADLIGGNPFLLLGFGTLCGLCHLAISDAACVLQPRLLGLQVRPLLSQDTKPVGISLHLAFQPRGRLCTRFTYVQDAAFLKPFTLGADFPQSLVVVLSLGLRPRGSSLAECGAFAPVLSTLTMLLFRSTMELGLIIELFVVDELGPLRAVWQSAVIDQERREICLAGLQLPPVLLCLSGKSQCISQRNRSFPDSPLPVCFVESSPAFIEEPCGLLVT